MHFHVSFIFHSFAGLATKMFQFLIPCLLASSALATSEEQCQVGDITFTGFDMKKVRKSDDHQFKKKS
jgi:hypothetical protein